MKQKRFSVVSLLLLLLSLLGAIGFKTFLGACVHEDGSFASCHYAGEALFGLSVLMAAQALAALFLTKERRGIYLCVALQAVLGLCLPGPLIRICSMATMRCRSVMRPGSIVVMVLLGLIALSGLFLEERKEKGQVYQSTR